MAVLPRSNPLHEQIPASRVNPPEMLGKMGTGGFTGYLSYTSDAAESYALFIKGILISCILFEGPRKKTGFEAIAGLYDHVLTESGQFSMYRMTADLVTCTHALLHGDFLLQPQEVRAVDLKALLAQMKLQALNGTVLFCAGERSAMIFYRDGAPIGFYHDGSREVESSPAESQRIAGLPGATVEIRSSQPTDSLLHHNLLEMVNIDKLWEAAKGRAAGRSTQQPVASSTAATDNKQEVGEADQSAVLEEIAEDLQEIAIAYLSRQGAALVERLLTAGGGTALLLDADKTAAFLASVTAEAPALDPEARIGEMVDLMQSEIAGRLSV